jgi:hypothetical protein
MTDSSMARAGRRSTPDTVYGVGRARGLTDTIDTSSQGTDGFSDFTRVGADMDRAIVAARPSVRTNHILSETLFDPYRLCPRPVTRRTLSARNIEG